jgi:hypothetical protein
MRTRSAETLDYYRSVLDGMDVPLDQPVPLLEFAGRAGIEWDTAKDIRSALRKAGMWPWPNARFGRTATHDDERILAAAARCHGSIRAIRAALGCCYRTATRARSRLRKAGRWPWPNAPHGPIENLLAGKNRVSR